jgi:hypothetical protein
MPDQNEHELSCDEISSSLSQRGSDPSRNPLSNVMLIIGHAEKERHGPRDTPLDNVIVFGLGMGSDQLRRRSGVTSPPPERLAFSSNNLSRGSLQGIA